MELGQKFILVFKMNLFFEQIEAIAKPFFSFSQAVFGNFISIIISENLNDSRHIWLPFEFEIGKPILKCTKNSNYE